MQLQICPMFIIPGQETRIHVATVAYATSNSSIYLCRRRCIVATSIAFNQMSASVPETAHEPSSSRPPPDTLVLKP